MELLLRWLNARTFLALGALAALIWAGENFGHIPIRMYLDWRYPPAERSPLGQAIHQDLDQVESLRLRALHKRVSREIQLARSKGLDVGRLQKAADAALALDKPGYRVAAGDRLQKLRMAIPQAAEQFRPAAPNEASVDEDIPTPSSR